jgi:uncharacterized protein YycO
MSIFQTIINSLLNAGALLTGIINWKLKNPLTDDEKAKINSMLVPNYYIILTRNNNHLSSYVIGLGDLIYEHKFGYWGHALMNMENEVVNNTDFRFVEAIGSGVQYATFDEVMEVNSIALLKPKNMSIEHWTAVLDKAYTEIGKPYDTLFDMKQDQKLSCVELVRNSLMAEPNYSTDFANFEEIVQKYGKITPQMFYNCPDFEVVYEVRH